MIGTNGSSTSENQAIKLRVGTKAKFDNVVLKGFTTGFDVQHNESVGYVGNGELKSTRVNFEEIGTRAKGTNSDGSAANVDAIFTEDNTATGAGDGSAAPAWATGWTLGL